MTDDQIPLYLTNIRNAITAAIDDGANHDPGNAHPSCIKAIVERFNHIPGTGSGGSASQIAERTALQALAATYAAQVNAIVAGDWATVVAQIAALTP